MPRNLFGGKKGKKGGNKKVNRGKNRKFMLKDDQKIKDLTGDFGCYGKVLKVLGGCPAQILILDEDDVTEYVCAVRGKMHKSEYLKPDDIVIFTPYNNDATSKKKLGEIVHKYLPEEISQLKKEGKDKINPKLFKNKSLNDNEEEDCGIDFTNEEEQSDNNLSSNFLKDLDNDEIDLDEI